MVPVVRALIINKGVNCMKAFIIGLVAAIIIAGGYLVLHKSPTKASATNSNSSTSTTNVIPQNGGGDHDGDNSGGPDDGDGAL